MCLSGICNLQAFVYGFIEKNTFSGCSNSSFRLFSFWFEAIWLYKANKDWLKRHSNFFFQIECNNESAIAKSGEQESRHRRLIKVHNQMPREWKNINFCSRNWSLLTWKHWINYLWNKERKKLTRQIRSRCCHGDGKISKNTLEYVWHITSLHWKPFGTYSCIEQFSVCNYILDHMHMLLVRYYSYSCLVWYDSSIPNI